MRAAREAGVSLVELMIAMGLAAGLLVVFVSVLATTQGLSAQSNAALMAHDEGRRSLDALANLLRPAASDSFTGFTGGTSTAPSFRCVTGADASGPVLDAVQTLSWRATTDPLGGVSSPGEVVVTRNGVSTVIARCVPGGGFTATLLGNTLKISLTTYCSSTRHKVATVSADVSIALRN